MEHAINIFSFLPEDLVHKYIHVLTTFVVIAALLIIGSFTKNMTKEVPGKVQSFFETIVESIYNFSLNTLGEEGKPYIPIIFGIAFYVFFSNILGLIPGFIAPTSNLNSTVAPAVVVFFTYNYIGIKKHGLAYIKHFIGPVIWLAPLMIIIELISHLARPLSLSIRLFGNIFGEDLVIAVLFMLVPYLIPLPMFFLGIFTCFIQTFVFMLLTLVYISGALEEAH
ncbi:MAG: F0F1 ATP synthase subunit A [Deferribacterota bacterium]|nr:F0F1 ATP synthase subunit A [Deferribacterota bacterium]